MEQPIAITKTCIQKETIAMGNKKTSSLMIEG